MSKREKRARLKKLQPLLLSKIQERFPLVEFQQIEERPDGVFALLLYAPYDDGVGIVDQVMEEISRLADEGVFLRVLPLDYRLDDRTPAKHRAA